MAGETTHRLGAYTVTVTDEFGPRIMGVRLDDGPEMLARLGPSVSLDGPHGTYHFRGGHRLWAAPEVPHVSYAPDDTACGVATGDGTIAVSAPADAAGFAKTITIGADGNALVVDHRLRWEGTEPVRVAPWAITLFPLGGTAIVPVAASAGDEHQADRTLVLWPYTDLTDPRLTFRAATVLVDAAGGPRLKIGTGPDPVRLGYLHDGCLFTKTVAPDTGGDHADFGAVAQVYTEADFCELESLGRLVDLAPGEEVVHRETWRVERCDGLDAAVEAVTP